MRLSLRKGAHAALSNAVWQEIRGSQGPFRGFLPRENHSSRSLSGHSNCETALRKATRSKTRSTSHSHLSNRGRQPIWDLRHDRTPHARSGRKNRYCEKSLEDRARPGSCVPQAALAACPRRLQGKRMQNTWSAGSRRYIGMQRGKQDGNSG